jgi:ubiquinone biosynthesis protein
MDEEFRRQVEEIVLAAADRDAERLTDAITRVCGEPPGLDRAALSADLVEFFSTYAIQEVGEFNVGGALTEAVNLLHQHKLVMPGKLSMLIKCLVVLEGTGRLLNPAFNLVDLLVPYRTQFLVRRYSPKAQVRKFARLYRDWERVAQTLPHALNDLVARFERGSFAVRLEHRHLKSAVNRLVVGLFVSALLVASAMLLRADVPPTLRGISVPGMLGYLVAIVIGFRLLWVNRDKIVADREGDWD